MEIINLAIVPLHCYLYSLASNKCAAMELGKFCKKGFGDHPHDPALVSKLQYYPTRCAVTMILDLLNFLRFNTNSCEKNVVPLSLEVVTVSVYALEPFNW